MDAVTALTATTPLDDARRVVVKIGSALLVEESTGAVRRPWLDALVDEHHAALARWERWSGEVREGVLPHLQSTCMAPDRDGLVYRIRLGARPDSADGRAAIMCLLYLKRVGMAESTARLLWRPTASALAERGEP